MGRDRIVVGRVCRVKSTHCVGLPYVLLGKTVIRLLWIINIIAEAGSECWKLFISSDCSWLSFIHLPRFGTHCTRLTSLKRSLKYWKSQWRLFPEKLFSRSGIATCVVYNRASCYNTTGNFAEIWWKSAGGTQGKLIELGNTFLAILFSKSRI